MKRLAGSRLAGLLGLLIALVLAPVAFTAATAPAGPQFPALTGRVVDDAHVLDAQTQADLTAKLAALEQQTTRQVVVVTLPSLGGYDIADYGNQLLRKWAIGQKATNNGALFIVVPSEHKVRIEVGYGLEDVMTDALSSVILQEKVLPKFRAGDVQGGVVDGTDAIIQQLGTDPNAAQAQIAKAQSAPRRHGSPLGAIVPLFVLFFILSRVLGGRRGGGGVGWLLPMMFLGGSRGGWGAVAAEAGEAEAAAASAAEAGPAAAAAPLEVGDMLSRIEEDRIEAAVTKAEETTSAEIVVVLAAEVSNYREVPLAWAAAAALILPPVALLLGFEPLSLTTNAGFWIAGQARALESEFMLALGLYAVVQAVLFLVVFAICEIPSVRRVITPKVLKRHRVERIAQQQFAAIGARAREAETGVLIFVAVDDRQVRILAPTEVHDQVGEPVWTRAVAAIGESMKAGHDPSAGVVQAVEICGAALSERYPAGVAGHTLSNRPIEI